MVIDGHGHVCHKDSVLQFCSFAVVAVTNAGDPHHTRAEKYKNTQTEQHPRKFQNGVLCTKKDVVATYQSNFHQNELRAGWRVLLLPLSINALLVHVFSTTTIIIATCCGCYIYFFYHCP